MLDLDHHLGLGLDLDHHLDLGLDLDLVPSCVDPGRDGHANRPTPQLTQAIKCPPTHTEVQLPPARRGPAPPAHQGPAPPAHQGPAPASTRARTRTPRHTRWPARSYTPRRARVVPVCPSASAREICLVALPGRHTHTSVTGLDTGDPTPGFSGNAFPERGRATRQINVTKPPPRKGTPTSWGSQDPLRGRGRVIGERPHRGNAVSCNARTHGQPQHTRRARRCNARPARRHGNRDCEYRRGCGEKRSVPHEARHRRPDTPTRGGEFQCLVCRAEGARHSGARPGALIPHPARGGRSAARGGERPRHAHRRKSSPPSPHGHQPTYCGQHPRITPLHSSKTMHKPANHGLAKHIIEPIGPTQSVSHHRGFDQTSLMFGHAPPRSDQTQTRVPHNLGRIRSSAQSSVTWLGPSLASPRGTRVRGSARPPRSGVITLPGFPHPSAAATRRCA